MSLVFAPFASGVLLALLGDEADFSTKARGTRRREGKGEGDEAGAIEAIEGIKGAIDEVLLRDLEAALRATAGETFGAEEQLLLPVGGVERASPTTDRPHEILLRMDPKSVSDTLLLAVLIAGAVRGDPVDASSRLLREVGLDVANLRHSATWERTAGVGPAGQARVVAALELARRIDLRDALSRRMAISRPADAVEVLRTMSLGPDEILAALFLDRRHRLLAGRILTVGSDAFTVVDPHQILREAISVGARAMILAHNHPSGDPTPSSQDLDVTRRVAGAGRVLSIPLIDHLVLGSVGRWVSLAERGELPPWASDVPGVTQ